MLTPEQLKVMDSAVLLVVPVVTLALYLAWLILAWPWGRRRR